MEIWVSMALWLVGLLLGRVVWVEGAMRGVVDGGGGRGVIWWDLNFEVWREAEHGEQRGVPLQSEQVMAAAVVLQRQQGGGGGSCEGFGRGIILRG